MARKSSPPDRPALPAPNATRAATARAKTAKTTAKADAPDARDAPVAHGATGDAEPTPVEQSRAEAIGVVSRGAEAIGAEAIARTLRVVADELERDPALAQRVAQALAGSPSAPLSPTPVADPATERVENEDGPPHLASTDTPADEPPAKRGSPRTFHPRIVTGVGPELGRGVPNPFELRERLGADGLRAALDELRLGSLRAIVREWKLDPSGRLVKQNDATKLRAAILDAVQP